jgi:SPP1 family phage portal protein
MLKFTVANFDEEHIDKNMILKLIQQHQIIADKIAILEDYYNGEHDIANRIRAKGAPNNKVIINYAKHITDVACGYFIGNPITYNNTANKDIDVLLKAFDNAHVDDCDADNAFELSQNGIGFEYVYVKEGETELSVKNLCAKNTFMIYDTSIEEKEVAGVYYRAVHDDAKDSIRYVATVCTKHYIYTLNILDGTDVQPIDEAPKEHFFGEVPIICYQNNHECIGDYEQLIPLIDAGNVVASDRVNDVAEFVDAVLVIYGTLLSDEGEEGNAKKALKDGKLLEFPDKQTMGAEWLTRQLDEQGVEVLQTYIRKEILRMACIPDFTDEAFAGNASGVAIAYKVLLLEWMTKTKERYYRIGLRKRIRMFCRFLDLKQILIDANCIIPHFVRSLPTNQTESANMISTLEGVVSHRTLLQQLPFIEDPDAEIEAVKKEKLENVELQRELFSMRPNTMPSNLDDEDEDTDADEDDDENVD